MMTKVERERRFNAELQDLQTKYGLNLQATYAIEKLNPSKAMLTAGIILVETPGWQPVKEMDDSEGPKQEEQ